MSSVTKKWSIEKIRSVIRRLDEKTGLAGAELNIVFGPLVYPSNGKQSRKYSYRRLGYYAPNIAEFGFNEEFFNDPNTKEIEVIDVIRHEYAHYYTDAVNVEKYIYCPTKDDHGADWKWACKMVGASANKYHDRYLPESEDVESLYNADDIAEIDVITYINKWDHLPATPEVEKRYLANIKKNNPNSYFEVGDEVLHPNKGFGTVIETVPYDFETQSLLIEFEDMPDGIFSSKEVCKMVNGCAIPFCSRYS